MDAAVQRLKQLQIAKDGLLSLKTSAAGTKDASRFSTAGNKNSKSVHGYFLANINVSPALGGPNNIHVLVCRVITPKNEDNRSEYKIYRDKTLKDEIIHELPPVEVAFHIWKSKKQLEGRPCNKIQLEITGCKAPWLPADQCQQFKLKLDEILSRLDTDEEKHFTLDDLDTKFEALVEYSNHHALFDMFTMQKLDGDSVRLTLILISKDREKYWEKTIRNRVIKWTGGNTYTVDSSLHDDFTFALVNGQNILLCEPWRARNVLIQFDKDQKRTAPPLFSAVMQPMRNEATAAVNKVAADHSTKRVEEKSAENLNYNKSVDDTDFHAVSTVETSNASASAAPPSRPFTTIALYEQNCRRWHRARPLKMITCTICFEEKQSSAFFRLTKCGHKFCHGCLNKLITIAISEGSAKSAKCSDAKCRQLIEYADVKKLVSPQLFEKFDRLLLELEIGAMDDVEVCPNTACNAQYVIDVVRLIEERRKTAQCPHCQSVLCVLCKQFLPCVDAPRHWAAAQPPPHVCVQNSVRIPQTVLDAYEASATATWVHVELEQMYGKQKLQNECDNRRSEREMDGKKKCPQCKAPCVKEGGCNKVICGKCTAMWCWICCTQIPANVGYSHFRKAGQACAGKLFANVPEKADRVAEAEPPRVLRRDAVVDQRRARFDLHFPPL